MPIFLGGRRHLASCLGAEAMSCLWKLPCILTAAYWFSAWPLSPDYPLAFDHASSIPSLIATNAILMFHSIGDVYPPSIHGRIVRNDVSDEEDGFVRC